jgi:hypothetical protein
MSECMQMGEINHRENKKEFKKKRACLISTISTREICICQSKETVNSGFDSHSFANVYFLI